MEPLSVIASVLQIADVGLRLSIKLYTFGEVVASADRSVIAISKDVSLTSGVLKELGQILERDKQTRTFSENAVQTADGVVKECLEVFRDMENILVKKLPSLGSGGKGGRQGERVKRATVMLEKLKWGFLQPKLQLLRSNLDRLKSTLLLMLNVITYAKQVSEKTESPSVIAEQKSLVEDLAHSNQDYINKFESLKIGIDAPGGDHSGDASDIAARQRESSTTHTPLPIAPRNKRMMIAAPSTPLQGEEDSLGLGSQKSPIATRSLPISENSMTASPANPQNSHINNSFINTNIQTGPAMPRVQEIERPITEASMGFEQEALFKQLEHYSMLIKNLVQEVDEAQYKITFGSRLRMKGGIAGLHEEERRELEKMWGWTALQCAEQRLDSLVGGVGELPRINRIAPPLFWEEATVLGRHAALLQYQPQPQPQPPPQPPPQPHIYAEAEAEAYVQAQADAYVQAQANWHAQPEPYTYAEAFARAQAEHEHQQAQMLSLQQAAPTSNTTFRESTTEADDKTVEGDAHGQGRDAIESDSMKARKNVEPLHARRCSAAFTSPSLSNAQPSQVPDRGAPELYALHPQTRNCMARTKRRRRCSATLPPDPAIGKPVEPETVDTEVADRLVALWTTVKL